jgi:hypothetical protein
MMESAMVMKTKVPKRWKNVVRQKNGDLMLSPEKVSSFDLVNSGDGYMYIRFLDLPGGKSMKLREAREMSREEDTKTTGETSDRFKSYLKTSDGNYLRLDSETHRVAMSETTLQGEEIEVDVNDAWRVLVNVLPHVKVLIDFAQSSRSQVKDSTVKDVLFEAISLNTSCNNHDTCRLAGEFLARMASSEFVTIDAGGNPLPSLPDTERILKVFEEDAKSKYGALAAMSVLADSANNKLHADRAMLPTIGKLEDKIFGALSDPDDPKIRELAADYFASPKIIPKRIAMLCQASLSTDENCSKIARQRLDNLASQRGSRTEDSCPGQWLKVVDSKGDVEQQSSELKAIGGDDCQGLGNGVLLCACNAELANAIVRAYGLPSVLEVALKDLEGDRKLELVISMLAEASTNQYGWKSMVMDVFFSSVGLCFRYR